MNSIKLPRPASVSIAELDHTVLDSDFKIPMYTMLFRTNGFLPESLERMYERNPEADRLTIVSAGCSSGAEADSLLALHRRSGFAGEITLKGFDANPKAVKAARAAEYLLRVFNDPDAMNEVEQTLQNFDFEVAEEVITVSEGVVCGESGAKFRKVSSKNIRQGIDITFEEANLKDGLGLLEPADLILANNVLLYFEEDDTLAIIKALAKSLSEQGILSFGDANNISSQAVQMLANKYGLKLIDSRQKAFVRE